MSPPTLSFLSHCKIPRVYAFQDFSAPLRPLGQVDYELLKFIYEKFEPQDAENQRFLNLLHALYMLEYRNAEQWYGLNPIVMDLLVQKGVIHVSS